ncbi:PREDICTED: uncharacterized protein LOC105560797 [Vollenhovia emeryi]|uniref:uncharacterized protein LOC105560797 n=1 Tax=Vollenhovia emeryi TaxID=411798 RepID=UPI0005F3A2D4|nr:PREDICTED: uncharacterized protein LOC105560797 [Vollenhovia emeryi]XP_011865608.1 PREDICTED: uncharacterized protein LOC105560797 [Vollenhovia emeryi]XP_011865609.1 PREDICTED: uncharacterized protein LOC105560797 [Vollenhovia emeryi]
MRESANNFTWTRQLECPPTVYNDSVRKILCKGVLELLWEVISNSAFPVAEACEIRKGLLLYKLKHVLKDAKISSVRNLNQLRLKSDALEQQISALEEEYEEQDYTVRQKVHHLKNVKSKRSTTGTRKDMLKLKCSETSKQMKDYNDMRRVYQHLMPNASKDVDQQRLRQALDVVTNLRRSAADRKQIWTKMSSTLGGIDVHTLWTHLCQALSQDVDTLKKLEAESDQLVGTSVVGENKDIGIARACGQHIAMASKSILSSTKANMCQEHLVEFIHLIESLSNEDMSVWLALKLEVRKLDTNQAYLQSEIRKLKGIIQENASHNHDLARLKSDIETIDAQTEKYIKDIQQSIAILNSMPTLVFNQKEKLHCELQKIVALQADNYDASCVNKPLNIELDIFHNTLDLGALRSVMLKGDVGLYRHAARGLDNVSIAAVNPQCKRIKPHFPIIQIPMYALIECYRNAITNIVYTKLHCSPSTDEPECAVKLVPSREKCNYNSLELLNLAKDVCDQAREEIKRSNVILSAWTNQDVQEAMALDETTVDGVSFKDWLQRYTLLLYMIQNSK